MESPWRTGLRRLALVAAVSVAGCQAPPGRGGLVWGAREALMAWLLTEGLKDKADLAPVVDAEPPEGCHLERHIVTFDGEVILCKGSCPGGGRCV